MEKVTVFAPATCANVAVGFDILGFALNAIGDSISIQRIDEPKVVITEITGTTENLPLDPVLNVSGAVLLKLIGDHQLNFGFELSIHKGIPLGSGMGGSAASSVGALVGANALLDSPLSKNELLSYALLGEKVASGSAHGDNVTPCLFGGLTLTRSLDPVDVINIPVPEGVFAVILHPHYRLDTRLSRSVLKKDLPLSDFVAQSANLAGFMAGCYSQDISLIKRSLKDVLIEPRRASLLPGFFPVKRAALDNGAIGCSISGSGPSIFAWVEGKEHAEKASREMVTAMESEGLQCDSWVSEINRQGAFIL